MREFDWDSELKTHRNRKLQAAEQWRWTKAARPDSVRTTGGRLLALAAAAASGAAATARQAVGTVQAWETGSSEPQEECC